MVPKPAVIAVDKPRVETFSVPKPAPDNSPDDSPPEAAEPTPVATSQDLQAREDAARVAELEARRQAEEAAALARDQQIERERQQALALERQRQAEKLAAERLAQQQARELAERQAAELAAQQAKEAAALARAQQIERERQETLAAEARRQAEETARQQALALERQRQAEKLAAERLAQQQARELAERQAAELAAQQAKEAAALARAQQIERERQEALATEARRQAEAAAAAQAAFGSGQGRTGDPSSGESRPSDSSGQRGTEQKHADALTAGSGGTGQRPAAKVPEPTRKAETPIVVPAKNPLPGDICRQKVAGWYKADVQVDLYAAVWRHTVSMEGDFDLLQDAKTGPYQNPIVTVAIRRDGHVESVTVHKSSGRPEIDSAVRRVIQMLAPYPPFSRELGIDCDVIEFPSMWTFNRALRVTWRGQ